MVIAMIVSYMNLHAVVNVCSGVLTCLLKCIPTSVHHLRFTLNLIYIPVFSDPILPSVQIDDWQTI